MKRFVTGGEIYLDGWAVSNSTLINNSPVRQLADASFLRYAQSEEAKRLSASIPQLVSN